MSFHFVAGKKITVSNFNFTDGKFDPVKHQMLVNFLKTAQHEFHFKRVSVSRANSFSKIGDVWFSRN